jgi:HemY protein
VLEEAWARAPHPDLAAPYLAEEPDPLMRVKAAEALARHNPGHPESRLLMAHTALDAGLTGRARTALEMLLRERGGAGADRRAYLMLEEVEEAEHGETPEARAAQARWLREAATARPEPFWRCGNCGTVHGAWRPVCTACDAVGQIAWTTPAAAAVPAPVARAATETA